MLAALCQANVLRHKCSLLMEGVWCRFIEQHGLSPGYREQIVQFITQNTGVRIPVDLSMNHDPFTGSGAYIPTPSTVSPYQPSHNSLTGGGVDPFTGQNLMTASQCLPLTQSLGSFLSSEVFHLDQRAFILLH